MPLDKTAKITAYALASRMNRAGCCWPGKTRLAADTSMSIRTVDRAIRRLEAAGLIVVRRRPPAPNLYTARLPRHCDGVTPSEMTDNPVTVTGEEERREQELLAYAFEPNPAWLDVAYGWLKAH